MKGIGLLAVAGMIAASTAWAAQPRDKVWTIGLTGQRQSLKSGDGNEILGNNGSFQIGTGLVARSWFATLSFDLLFGPYEPTRQGQVTVDYAGTGFTLWSGLSAQTLDLRSEAGSYGFALGVSYADAIGRSLAGKFGEDDPARSEVIDDYIVRITNLSLLPAVFFSWLKASRPAGNTPELLATRVEGYFLSVGMAVPLMVSYNTRYSLRTTTAESDKAAQAVEEKGRMRGYSVLVALTAILGT